MADERLNTLIATWHQARAAGRDIPLAELCRDAPELLPAVAAELTARKPVDSTARGSRPIPAGGNPGTLAAPDPDAWPAVAPPPAGESSHATTPKGTVRRPTPAAPPAAEAGPVSPPGYELEAELGRGGMGVVWRARDTQLNRTVALKMMLDGGRPNPQELARFHVEAEAVAAIDHPNVVRVFGFGESAGRPYLVMEYLDGGSLAGLLKGADRPGLKEAARLVEQVARGVQAAHALGIVHRDLKPGNILLQIADFRLKIEDSRSTGGRQPDELVRQLSIGNLQSAIPKVADFGLARREGDPGLTATGDLMGTPAYMAPEQAKDAKYVGPPADIYAIGAVLYQCLTGAPPFTGSDPWSIIRRVIDEPPVPPRRQAPAVPKDLERVCLKCLEKDPRDRYATAEELADDLARWRAGEPVSVRSSGPVERAAKWARRRPTAAAAWALGALAVLLTGFGGVATALWQEAVRAEGEAVAANAQLAGEKRQTEDALARESVARTAAVTAQGEAEAAREREAGERKQAEAAADRERTAKVAEATARKTAEAATAAETAARRAAEAAADRERSALGRLAAAQYARTVDLAHREYHANDLRRAAALLADCPPARRGWEWEYVSRLLHPAGRVFDPKAGFAYAVAFDPAGKRLATAHQDKTARLWAADTGAAGPVLRGHADEVLDAAFTPDGKEVVTAGKDGVVKVWDAASGAVRLTLAPPADDPADRPKPLFAVAVAPDGKAVSAGGAAGQFLTWRLDTGENRAAQDVGVGEITAVRISPDGVWAAAGGKGGRVKVWKRAATVAPTAVTASGDVLSLAFAPDGRLAVGAAAGLVQVFDPETGRPGLVFQAHAPGVRGLVFAADGTKLVTAGKDRAVGVWDSATGRPLLMFKGHADAVWGVAAAGGRAASVGLDGTVRLWGLDGSPEYRSFPVGGDEVTCLVPLPDGQLFVGQKGRSGITRVEVRRGSPAAAQSSDRPDRPSEVVALAADPAEVRWVDDGGFFRQMALGEKRADAVKPRALAVEDPLARRRVAAGFGPGKRVAVGTADGRVAVRASPEAGPEWEFVAHPGPLSAVGYSRDGGRLLTGDGAGRAALWDTAGQRKVSDLTGHTGGVLAAAFRPDGGAVATASADHTTRLWDAATGRELQVLRGHLFWVRAVCWSPDGKRVATASGDGTAKVWDPATGAELLTLPAGGGAATAAAFSADGRTLFVGGGDGTVRAFAAGPPAGP